MTPALRPVTLARPSHVDPGQGWHSHNMLLLARAKDAHLLVPAIKCGSVCAPSQPQTSNKRRNTSHRKVYDKKRRKILQSSLRLTKKALLKAFIHLSRHPSSLSVTIHPSIHLFTYLPMHSSIYLSYFLSPPVTVRQGQTDINAPSGIFL